MCLKSVFCLISWFFFWGLVNNEQQKVIGKRFKKMPLVRVSVLSIFNIYLKKIKYKIINSLQNSLIQIIDIRFQLDFNSVCVYNFILFCVSKHIANIEYKKIFN